MNTKKTMIHQLIAQTNPFIVASVLGTSLLVPFTYFIYDVNKNPGKYEEH